MPVQTIVFYRKKKTGGLAVIPFKIHPDDLFRVKDTFELICELPGVVSDDPKHVVGLAYRTFLEGARWARKNPDKEISED
jgi:hypothetical protein